MGQVLEFEKPEPHGQGPAFCLSCSHEWQAVAPAGETVFECPNCHAHKGRYRYEFVPPEGKVWECNCGNQLFYITPNGTFCPECGTYAHF